MNKKIYPFPFFVTYADIDTYCFWLVDAYGEHSRIVDVIDKNNFTDKCDNPQKYKKNADEILLELRQTLLDAGFEKEVNACDLAFTEKFQSRAKSMRYIPMSKRK